MNTLCSRLSRVYSAAGKVALALVSVLLITAMYFYHVKTKMVIHHFKWYLNTGPDQSPVNKPFIFIESSCVANQTQVLKGGLKLNGRQACAIYSTAKLHPKRTVYLFHSCPLAEDFYAVSSEGAKALSKLPNVIVVRPNVSDWFSGTPVEGRRSDLTSSAHPVEHASDLLRLALVWKIGATYLDLDALTIKSFEDLGSNWVCAHPYNGISNGLMDFDRGHKVPLWAMERINKSYDPRGWSTNGPLLLQSVIATECLDSTGFIKWAEVGELKKCSTKVLPPQVMFPYPYTWWKVFFMEPKDETVKVDIYLRFGESHSIHLFNYMSSRATSNGSRSPLRVMASIHCDPVYRAEPGAF